MDCDGNYVGHPLTGLIYYRKGPIASCMTGTAIVFVSYWRIRWTLLNHHEGGLSTVFGLRWPFVGLALGVYWDIYRALVQPPRFYLRHQQTIIWQLELEW